MPNLPSSLRSILFALVLGAIGMAVTLAAITIGPQLTDVIPQGQYPVFTSAAFGFITAVGAWVWVEAGKFIEYLFPQLRDYWDSGAGSE